MLPEELEGALVREGRSASRLVTGTCGHGGIAEALLGVGEPDRRRARALSDGRRTPQ
ncbi:hypothetical protein WKI71_43040 [Streptomyces sp. MS1.AVA.1]|uniref:Uncharacterized protein n=1 Tax=Streptomyces machairae TaxID=3134109 RepID=A0ABU8UUT3_9ACTN